MDKININLEELIKNDLFMEFLADKIANIIINRNTDSFNILNKDLLDCIYKRIDNKCEILIKEYVENEDILRKSEQKVFSLLGNMVSKYNQIKMD